VEAYIDANFPIARDRDWIRAHKDDIFGGDDSRKQLAILGDQAANLRGFKPGTDAYYAFLDAHMGYEAEVDDDNEVAPPPPPVARTAAVKAKRAPGAPSGRAALGKAGSGGEAASPEVVALARDLGMSPAKYMEYQEGLAAGKYPGYRLLK
jgi:pyruvate/2-oxoglutarate dehydrogenase complex dihydrolipoamide acyltransferase (E2) component